MQEVITKQSLDALSAQIQSKRNPSRDGKFEIENLVLSDYDIRMSRDIDEMIRTLKRDGQLDALTITINRGFAVIINGRTRFEAMIRLGWKTTYCEVYENLTQIEQDYLNAIINTNQHPLTSDERLRFVEHHKDQLDIGDLARALGIGEGRVMAYIAVSNLPEDVRELCRTNSEGRERGEYEIDTLNIVAGVKDDSAKVQLAEHAGDLIRDGKTDRARRTEIRRKRDAINALVPMAEKLGMAPHEIIGAVIERPAQRVSSVLRIAEGSEGKFDAFNEILSRGKFEEVIIFNPTFPMMVNGESVIKSEALIATEYAKTHDMHVTLVDRSDSEASAWKERGGNVLKMSAEEYLFTRFTPSDEKTLIYFNLSGDREAREFLSKELIASIKQMRPKCVILFIITEEWIFPTNVDSNYLELLRFFGIDRTINPNRMTIEHFLKKLGYAFRVCWEKTETRRVALVTI